jgi:hypothetical protein
MEYLTHWLTLTQDSQTNLSTMDIKPHVHSLSHCKQGVTEIEKYATIDGKINIFKTTSKVDIRHRTILAKWGQHCPNIVHH